MKLNKSKPDVTVRGSPGASTQFVVTPVTKLGRAWVEQHVSYEDWQLIGSQGIAVDHHYIQDLVLGMQEAGLAVVGAGA